jgi:PAS domain S-box-containing protein
LNVGSKNEGEISEVNRQALEALGHLIGDLIGRIRTEEELKKSEEKYRALIEATNTGYLILNERGAVLDANQAYLRLIGRKDLNEIAGKSVAEWTAAHDIVRNVAEVEKCMATGSVRNLEIDYVDASGHIVPIDVCANVIYTPEGKRILSLCRDISARKKLDAALRDSEESFRMLFECVGEGVIIYDRDFRYTYWNPYMENLTGFTASEVVGKCAFDLFPHLKKHGVDIMMRRVLHGETVAASNMEYTSPITGKTSRTSGVYHPYRNSKGEIVGMIGIVRDITELWNAEQALRASEERFRRLSENLPDILMRWIPNYGLDYVNAAIERIIGLKKENVIGRFGYLMSIVHPDDRNTIAKVFLDIGLNKAELARCECRVIDKAGETVWFDLLWKPVWDEKGNLAAVEAIGRDITDRKKSEMENARLQQQLLHSQKMEAIGALAGGMAHDFNNILAIISGTTEFLMGKMPSDSPHLSQLARIQRSTRKARDLSMKLLTFARKEKLSVRAANANDLILDVIDMLKGSVSKKIIINKKLSADLKKISVDTNQISQAVLNICINACDAMPEGGELTIETSMTEICKTSPGADSGPGLYCSISIADTGAGIDPQVKNKIFEPFFTTKEMGKGSGLGLSISHGIIEKHNGFITVESAPAKGSAFTIFIPACETDGAETTGTPEAEPRGGMKGSVFIIDDDRDFVQTMRDVLESEGFKVFFSYSGREAVKRYEEMKDSVDVIMLDMMMPEMDGAETFAAIKKTNPAAKIALCSGYSVEGKASELMNSGADAFIQKPFIIKEVLDVFSALTRQSE